MYVQFRTAAVIAGMYVHVCLWLDAINVLQTVYAVRVFEVRRIRRRLLQASWFTSRKLKANAAAAVGNASNLISCQGKPDSFSIFRVITNLKVS